MNKNQKIVIASVIGLLLLVIVVMFFKNKSLTKSNQIQSVELLMANDSAKMYKTKAGEAYFTLNSVVIEKNALKKSLIETGLTIKDLRQKDVNWRNINSVLTAKLEAAGHAVTTIHDTTYIDTSGVVKPAKDFVWSNSHLSLNGLIKEKDIDIAYKYQVGLKTISETKGNETKITIYSDDPNAKIVTGYQINVKTKIPFYKKWYVWATAGLVGGYFITK